MFKIGDFSRLSRVSVRALRLYDQMGLLHPVHVDSATGYRYYSAEQLSCLNRIVAFKELGFSLEQIAQLLHDQLPPAQIRGMLRLKQAEVQQAIEAEQARLTRIEARLQQIEQEGASSTYDIVLKSIDPQPVAALRDVLPTCRDVIRLHTQLTHSLHQQNISTAGLRQTLWHDAEYRLTEVDAEAIVPISLEAVGGASLKPYTFKTYTLPKVEQMAAVIHQGSYDTVVHAFNALLQWIEAHHYQVAGSHREIYIQPTALTPGFAVGEESAVIEIQFPVDELPMG